MRSILKYFKTEENPSGLFFLILNIKVWQADSVRSISQIKEIFDVSPCSIFVPFSEVLYAKSTVTEREVELQKFISGCTIPRSLFSEILNTQTLLTFRVICTCNLEESHNEQLLRARFTLASLLALVTKT